MMIEQLKILNYVELHTQHTSLVGGDSLRFRVGKSEETASLDEEGPIK